jgi:hypothetical protein
MPHTNASLYDTSTGNYVSADQEDTTKGNILVDEGIRASSGGRGNAYKKAVYDPHGEIKDLGGEYRHNEWEKHESSGVSEKKSSGATGAGQARFATETGSYVGEFMGMFSPRSRGRNPARECRGIRPSWKALITQGGIERHGRSRKLVDEGGAVDTEPSDLKGSLESRERMDKSRDTGKNVTGRREKEDWSKAYKKLDGSLDAKERLDAAFDGVDGLLCFGYSPTGDVSGSAKMLIDAAVKKGIGHVIYLSLQGASKKTGAGHLDSMFEMEQHLKKSGLSYTILRPALYMEHIFPDKALSSLHEGHLDVPLSPDRPIDLVSASDVGRVVAEVFQVPGKFNGRRSTCPRIGCP